MNAEEGIDIILVLFGLFLLLSLLIINFKQTIIGISIGLAMLAREGGVSLLFISLLWLTILSVKKRSISFLSSFIIILISSVLTVNILYGFKSSGIYFFNYIPLPVPYLFYNSIVNSILHSQAGHTAYVFGKISQKGWIHYYLIVFLLKTPLPLILLFIIGLLSKRIKLEDKLLLLLPIPVIFISYSLSRVDLGVRLLLPIYPFVFIVSSVAFKKARGMFSLILLILVSWHALESLLSYPFYLSYCNQLARGKCYLYLSDSNIDWGQNIYLLGELSKKEKIYCGPLFGGITPNLNCIFVDCEEKNNLIGLDGYLAISQFELYVGRKCYWLRSLEPNKILGGSIFLYDLKALT